MKILNYIPLFLLLTSCSAKLDIKTSKHYDGDTFFNPNFPDISKGFVDLWKWRLSDAKKWPESVDIKQLKVPQKRTKRGELSVTFINHATVLIQLDGVNIIADPIWSKRTSPVSFIGPARVKKAGIKFEDLPKIDLVLISHNHYDHLDLPTLEKLVARDNPMMLFGLGNAHYLGSEFNQNTAELDWNQSAEFNNVKITFLRSKHWSKRNLLDYNKSLWGAFAIEGSKKVYFGGDTGYDDHFKEAGDKFGPFDLSLIPIGAYEPRWFMKDFHINPTESVKAHFDLNSRFSVGIHFGTFQLTNEGIDDPVKDLHVEAVKHSIVDRFITLKNGESLKIK